MALYDYHSTLPVDVNNIFEVLLLLASSVSIWGISVVPPFSKSSVSLAYHKHVKPPLGLVKSSSLVSHHLTNMMSWGYSLKSERGSSTGNISWLGLDKKFLSWF